MIFLVNPRASLMSLMGRARAGRQGPDCTRREETTLGQAVWLTIRRAAAQARAARRLQQS